MSITKTIPPGRLGPPVSCATATSSLSLTRSCELSSGHCQIEYREADALRVLLFRSTGHIGSPVDERLKSTHDVVVASRSSGLLVDILDPDSIGALFDKVGKVDAVVATVGSVPFKPFEDLQRADFLAGLCNKALGQSIEGAQTGRIYIVD
jgi:hypothetical protein